MLCTTILFYEFYGLATCLPEVVISPGWLSVIGIAFVMTTLPEWGVRGCGLVWALWVDIGIRAVRYSCFCLWSLPVFSVFYLAARHLFVRALPNSSIRIHCIPSIAWDLRVTVGFLIEVEYFCNISFIAWGMVIAQSSSCHPFCTRSSISSLYFSSCFGRGGGRKVVT